jgi:hypothetical protein
MKTGSERKPRTVSKHSFDVLLPTIRKPGSEIWVTFNPDLEEDDAWQRFVLWTAPGSMVQQINWSDNPWFPAELRTEKDHLKTRDIDAYENVWEGRCRSHVIGALWTKEIFEANRQPRAQSEKEREALMATLRRVVIAIDPSGCAGEEDKRSDEIGIVVAGIGHDGIARVLEDATGRYSPDEWANKALALFDRWKGDKIVAETNYGGAMVDSTIRTARRTAPVKLVNASRGKVCSGPSRFPRSMIRARSGTLASSRNWSGSSAIFRPQGIWARGRRITPTRRYGHLPN